jgi:hypothetical protein
MASAPTVICSELSSLGEYITRVLPFWHNISHTQNSQATLALLILKREPLRINPERFLLMICCDMRGELSNMPDFLFNESHLFATWEHDESLSY